jgi:hypothetical protein
VYFPEGRYRIGDALTLHPVSGSYAGITFRGTGWAFGATPATNVGSVIELTSTSGSALVLGPTSGSGSPLINFTMYDMAVQATNPYYRGDVVDIRNVGKCWFENCGFGGLPLAKSATASSLIHGNQWVDTHFVRCQFSTAAYGVWKALLGQGWNDYANNVSFVRCVFSRCTASADIQGSVADVWFDQCTFEPAVDGSAATIHLSGYPAGGLRGCWLGDSNGAGTWIKLGGFGGVVIGNYISGMAHPDSPPPKWPESTQIGLELTDTTLGPVVEGNYFDNNMTAVKATTNSLLMTGNVFSLPPNGTALDLSDDTGAMVTGNLVIPVDSTAAVPPTAYKLAVGTRGELVDLAGAPVQNNAGENWRITQAQLTSYSRYAHLVTTWNMELQGYLSMTGSVGSPPEATTRFIGDAGSPNVFYHNVPKGGSIIFGDGGKIMARLDRSGAKKDDTSLIVMRRTGDTWSEVRVSQGAAGSGGLGHRVLRIPN